MPMWENSSPTMKLAARFQFLSTGGWRLRFHLFAHIAEWRIERVDKHEKAFIHGLRHLKTAARLDIGKTVQPSPNHADRMDEKVVRNAVAFDDGAKNLDRTRRLRSSAVEPGLKAACPNE
jgi:hypothetical protein